MDYDEPEPSPWDGGPVNTYSVEVDGEEHQLLASSLAELASKVRGTGARIKVWAPNGTQLIDTKFGDSYSLVS